MFSRPACRPVFTGCKGCKGLMIAVLWLTLNQTSAARAVHTASNTTTSHQECIAQLPGENKPVVSTPSPGSPGTLWVDESDRAIRRTLLLLSAFAMIPLSMVVVVCRSLVAPKQKHRSAGALLQALEPGAADQQVAMAKPGNPELAQSLHRVAQLRSIAARKVSQALNMFALLQKEPDTTCVQEVLAAIDRLAREAREAADQTESVARGLGKEACEATYEVRTSAYTVEKVARDAHYLCRTATSSPGAEP